MSEKTVDKCCDQIKSLIEFGDPFLIGKIGATELNVLAHANNGYIIQPESDMGIQCQNAAGIYPIDNNAVVLSFYKSILSAVKQMDGIVYSVGEKKIDKNFVENVWGIIVPSEYTSESFRVINKTNWTRSLDGKKAVVVSPFKNTFETQYVIKDEWDMMKWCPEFSEVNFVKSNHSRAVDANGFTNWVDEYDRIWTEINSHDYDVVLLGCGSFGLPLGGRVRESGKSAIHMGGELQNMFGVKGKMFMLRNEYACYMNDKWIRPFHSEIPSDVKNFSPIHGPCYF